MTEQVKRIVRIAATTAIVVVLAAAVGAVVARILPM